MEFAKRFFYKGFEISPFPISALGELSSRNYLLGQLFIEQRDRGWPLPIPSIAIAEFYSSIFIFPRSFRTKSGKVVE
jgi:hypothetical protein